ncbi:hypothetical protein K2173_020901 [Erythroxylum novogranatense]|uniref:Uncharacterized protein n=1 Tax=Erythroxylum novogranatense TaxID=1862640 RepID=A0AAV8TM47_9ROSI|nr:hypothetical protein K2173_020901 [Erythroxylum novogranatense]
MPKPGPRPYECVKKAWHNKRHQPMRGLIIHQIFTHSTATRNNKEWLEKLPVVVLRAEEIMYSKANSEVEYLDSETLWDRLNDAVDTIIRRDESSETGEFLPPFVEEKGINSWIFTAPRLCLFCSSTNSLFHIPVLDANHLTTRTGTIIPLGSYPYLYGNVPSSGLIARKTNTGQQNNMQLNLGSVYPLYYGHQYQMDESQLNSQVPEKMNFNTLFVGKSVSRSVVEPAEVAVLQNFLSCSGGLSIVSDTCLNMERSLARETVGIASSSSQDKSMYVDLLPQTNNINEFCVFPGRGPNQPLESCSIKLFANKEDQYLDATIRKCKAPFSDNAENGQFWSSVK